MLKVDLSFSFFYVLAFNLISFLFMSSSLSTKICINWFWKYFWIARLNFSIISLVIFITTTWFDLIRWGYGNCISWKMADQSNLAKYRRYFQLCDGNVSWFLQWYMIFFNNDLSFFWISIVPVIITKTAALSSPSEIIISPTLNF